MRDIVVAADGLWLQARPPAQGTQAAIFVPWAEIRDAQPTRLYWRAAVRLACGEPAAGSITVWQPVWDVAGPLWQAAWQAPPAPPARRPRRPPDESQGAAAAAAGITGAWPSGRPDRRAAWRARRRPSRR